MRDVKIVSVEVDCYDVASDFWYVHGLNKARQRVFSSVELRADDAEKLFSQLSKCLTPEQKEPEQPKPLSDAPRGPKPPCLNCYNKYCGDKREPFCNIHNNWWKYLPKSPEKPKTERCMTYFDSEGQCCCGSGECFSVMTIFKAKNSDRFVGLEYFGMSSLSVDYPLYRKPGTSTFSTVCENANEVEVVHPVAVHFRMR